MLRLLGSASLWALLVIPAPLAADDVTDLTVQLQSTLDSFRDRYGLPGATVAIVLADATVIDVGTGLADVEAGIPMTAQSRMLAASIGKTFVGATILALESEGVLAREDRVSDHLGDYPWFETLPNADTMTVGHLLRHEAGLADHPHLPAFQQAFAQRIETGAAAFTPVELLEFAAGQEALFRAGEGWAYSDTGYILLGLIIESVAGTPYYEYVQTTFLEPLGLDHTGPSNDRALEGLAVGYTSPGNPYGLPERTVSDAGTLLWDPAAEWTGGGLISISADLAIWGHALFGGFAMSPTYLDRLLETVPISSDVPGVGYGAGVAVYSDTPHGPVYGHGGWIPAYVSSLRHYADHSITIAFQINSDDGIFDDRSDVVPALEAALAELVINYMHTDQSQ